VNYVITIYNKEKSPKFDEVWYNTTADLELDDSQVTKYNKKFIGR